MRTGVTVIYMTPCKETKNWQNTDSDSEMYQDFDYKEDFEVRHWLLVAIQRGRFFSESLNQSTHSSTRESKLAQIPEILTNSFPFLTTTQQPGIRVNALP